MKKSESKKNQEVAESTPTESESPQKATGWKPLPPKRTGETKVSIEEIVKAIEGSRGNKSKIARSLGVERTTIHVYLAKFASVRKAYESECERILDMAEDVVNTAVANGDVDTAKWVLRMQGKDRGYVERQEIAEVDPYRNVRKVVFEVAGTNGKGNVLPLKPSNGNGHKEVREGTA